MLFSMSGFTQDLGFRVFSFVRIEINGGQSDFTVRADLAIVRKYAIPVQELPLLCRGLLEGQDADDPRRTLTFSEEELRIFSDHRSAERAEALKKRQWRKRAGANPANGGNDALLGDPQKISSNIEAIVWHCTNCQLSSQFTHTRNEPGFMIYKRIEAAHQEAAPTCTWDRTDIRVRREPSISST